MADITINKVQKADIPMLDTALRKLSDELGDSHRATAGTLTNAALGPMPSIHAMLAKDHEQLLGTVVFSPAFSTVKGVAGLFVSDLWVAAAARGCGLGPRLLAAAADWADNLWQARYLKLAVYDTSPKARRFYDKIGFRGISDESTLILDENGLTALKGCP